MIELITNTNDWQLGLSYEWQQWEAEIVSEETLPEWMLEHAYEHGWV